MTGQVRRQPGRVMGRLLPILIALQLAVPALAAASTGAREQAELASLVAAERLRAEVLRAPLAPGLTVGSFIERTNSRARLDSVFDQAEQLGGPRWPDEQTCQVRIELRGAVVADELLAIARDHPGRSPLPADELAKSVRPIRDRVFNASGVSVSADAIDRLPAGVGGAWASLDAASRAAAVRSARQQAIAEAFEAIDPMVLPDGSTLGERRRANRQVDASIREFLAELPVVPLGWDDDLTARVAVTIPMDAFGRSLAELIPGTDAGAYRERLAAQLRGKPRLMVGEARAVPPGPGPGADAAPTPSWSRELILVEGNASAAATRLQTIRVAEQDAQGRLRERVLSLPMGDGLPLSRQVAARRSVELAVDRSLSLASTARITFHADGSATVQLALDGRVLWQSIVDADR